jgi:small subunit ribosomal protein S20
MPHSRSSRKRVRQNETRRLSNLSTRGAYRAAEKKILGLLEAGKADEAKSMLPSVYQSLDKAAKRRVLHPNTAANHKRKIATRVAKAQGGKKAK